MKTKLVVCLCVLFMLSVPFTIAATNWSAKYTVKAVDEDGNPLEGIEIFAGLGGKDRFKGKTDSNGLFVVESQNVMIREGGCFANKTDYYETHVEVSFPTFVDGRCQPWNPVITTVVRRIVTPIPMYAKCVETRIPRTNELFGYDLEVGAWVSPMGKGVVSDLVFRVEGVWNNYRDNDSTLALAFTQLNDGLVTVAHDVLDRRPTGSTFILPRYAPDNGYDNAKQWRRSRKRINGSDQDQIIDEVNEEGRDYIFRVRSRTNETGVITNAYYGKFHGNIEFVGAAGNGQGSWLKFTYYLNPTPNDRNLEFDPKRNLFQNLNSTEQVVAP